MKKLFNKISTLPPFTKKYNFSYVRDNSSYTNF